MNRVILRIRCIIVTGHKMENYQTKIVDGLRGKVEAHNKRCVDCEYLEKFWVAKEKFRQPVRYD